MSSFEHFEDLDEVTAFGDYLVQVEAIPEGGFLHLRTRPVKMKPNPIRAYKTQIRKADPSWAATVQDTFSHGAKLADKFPEQYRAFKTLRRLTT